MVRRDPEVVVLVDDQAVGAVDAVGEDARRAMHMGHSVEWNLDDAVVAGVGHEQDGLLVIEIQTVGSERREPGRSEQHVADPSRHIPSGAVGSPDRPEERVRDVDVSDVVERQSIQASACSGRSEEDRRSAGQWIHLEHSSRSEIEDQEIPGQGVESEAEQQVAGPRDSDVAQQLPVRSEDDEVTGAGGTDAEGGGVDVSR